MKVDRIVKSAVAVATEIVPLEDVCASSSFESAIAMIFPIFLLRHSKKFETAEVVLYKTISFTKSSLQRPASAAESIEFSMIAEPIDGDSVALSSFLAVEFV